MKKNEDKIGRKVCGLFLEYKKYFPGIFICLACTSFMTFLQPLIIRRITDQGMVAGDMICILIFSGWLVGISVISQIIEIVQTKLFSNIHNELTFSLYQKAYWKMERLKIDYFDEKGSTEISNTISSDISNMASAADQITTFSISSILQIVGGIVGLSILDWKLALLITLVVPVKYLVVYHFSRKKNQLFEQLIENNRAFSGWFGDCIDGIREMKLWDLFRIKSRDFKMLQKRMMDSYKENMMIDEYRTFSISALDALLNAALYILSGLLIIKGELSIGGAFAFIAYSGYVVSPISFLINIKYYFAQIIPSAKRYFEFLDQPEEENGTDRIFGSGNQEPVLELIGIRFGYKEDAPILNDVNLTVHQGEKIAIIGENGSGKSTLFDLILGFRRPGQGFIKLWGVPTENLKLKDIRNRIAVVSQKPYLFQGTIEENVNIERTALHRDVLDSCIKSGAIAFIDRLEDGFKQCIGRNGAKLSGGEKQKLAVARAILKKADILLMDEATSGFDNESDRELFHMMCSKLDEKTIIFITHRFEELDGVETVYKLTEGRLELQYK